MTLPAQCPQNPNKSILSKVDGSFDKREKKFKRNAEFCVD